MLATYMQRMCNKNLEIRIARFTCCLQKINNYTNRLQDVNYIGNSLPVEHWGYHNYNSNTAKNNGKNTFKAKKSTFKHVHCNAILRNIVIIMQRHL